MSYNLQCNDSAAADAIDPAVRAGAMVRRTGSGHSSVAHPQLRVIAAIALVAFSAAMVNHETEQ